MPADRAPRPPSHLTWLVDLVGAEATLSLLELHAGTRIYIPQQSKNSWIVRELGTKHAATLSKAHGGEHVELPVAKAWRAEMYRLRGDTHRAIALKLGMTEKSVRRYLQQASMTDPDASRPNPAGQARPARRRRRAHPDRERTVPTKQLNLL